MKMQGLLNIITQNEIKRYKQQYIISNSDLRVISEFVINKLSDNNFIFNSNEGINRISDNVTTEFKELMQDLKLNEVV